MSAFARSSLFTALLGLALSLGCGEKPKPKAPPVPQARQEQSQTPPTPPPPPPSERTPGGVDLNSLVPEGPDALAIIDAAKNLARDKTAIKRLEAAGPAVKGLVIGLLGSQSIDEVLAALDLIAAANDPTTARAAIAGDIARFTALLGHEVREVRDRAWQVAPLVANGDALVALLDASADPDTRRGIIRLLAGWDSPSIRKTLAHTIRTGTPELADEAVLALARPERQGEDIVDLALALLADAPLVARGLGLTHRLPPSAFASHAPVLTRAIDGVLTDRTKHSTVTISSAIRAASNLPRGEHLPLLSQLAGDPDPNIRRVAIETLGNLVNLPPEVLSTVEKGLDDLEGSVRIAAIRARAALARGPSKTPESLEKTANILAPKLSEAHQGVRLAAVSVLAQADFAPWSAAPLKARIDAEKGPGRELVLVALAASRHRALAALVVDKLNDGDLRPAAHLALTSAAGQDFPADVKSWQGWLDTLGPAESP